MPRHSINPIGCPPVTPPHVRHSFDQIVDRLNARWELGIPKVSGTEKNAEEQAGIQHPLARQCANQIRYLCFRASGLDQVISDFEDEIPRLCSDWVWKPSQEEGTLPRLSVTKSFISRRRSLPAKHRQVLLERLSELLGEEFKLARMSEVYRRTSINTPVGHTTTGARLEEDRPHAGPPAKASTSTGAISTRGAATEIGGEDGQVRRSREVMKRKSSGSEKSTKSPKKQMTLSQLEQRRLEQRRPRHEQRQVTASPSKLHQPVGFPIATNTTSFASIATSNVPSEVFTPATNGIEALPTTAATSFEGQAENSDPDYFPTQEVEEIEADETFTTSYKSLCQPTPADKIFHDLCARSPFQSYDLDLPYKRYFRYRHELQRVADALKMTADDLLSKLRQKGISASDQYDAFWSAGYEIARNARARLPERSSTAAWNSAVDSFFENERRKRSVYIGGKLRFKSQIDGALLEFALNPLQLFTSCRFHRKYGPSRFMVVSLPSLSTEAPAKVKEQSRSGALVEGVARWLATVHEILGRKWKAFFVEASSNKQKAGQPAAGYKVHLFAVSGEGIPPESAVEMVDFLNWHMPISHNLKSTNLKLFNRFSLGLSKTWPTFPLESSEFIRLPDPVGHAVMNDGCARMSRTLAKDISRQLGISDVPSVFQGRIAGAKGLWMVVPDEEFSELGKRNYCIEIADSQLKIHPHPMHNSMADKEQRSFEVLKYSGSPNGAVLNRQLLTVLHHGGVKAEVLGELLEADIGQFYDALKDSMRSPILLRSWLQSNGRHAGNEGVIKMTGSWPDDAEEQAKLLVENGFDPRTSPDLRESLRTMLSSYLTRYVEVLKIHIPCSVYLFCIADPYGVLAPDEVHLSFSEVWRDANSDFKESFLDGQDILVARSPVLFPSDVQRRRAVWRKELHHFKDVIVFPTTGDVPLAHLLSGGDYDGDKPWICWDPKVVRDFRDEGLPNMPSKKACGLVQHNRQMQDVFSNGISHEQLASQIDGFFTGCFAFNLHPSFLGQCTVEHEKVTYWEGTLRSSKAIKLATMCGYLVDSPKQGDMLSEAAWQKLRKEVSPYTRKDPAYKNEGSETYRRRSNVMDYLKFWRAVPTKDRILAEFSQDWPQQPERDTSLRQPSKCMEEFAKASKSPANLEATLKQLRDEVKIVVEESRRLQPRDNNWASGEFRRLADETCHQFRNIQPLGIEHEFSCLWKYEAGHKFGHWQLLRASYLYHKFQSWKLLWYVAGEELCYIKAQAEPDGFRTVLTRFYPLLKCDGKIARKVQQRLDDVDSGDEAFECEDEEEDD